jgi:hypothetical protein
MKLFINNSPQQVEWEHNESVEALRQRIKEKPITIQMRKYGTFEQVGTIGNLPADDHYISTLPGDIVLYNHNQIVIFYDEHAYHYTRLGRIIGKSKEEFYQLLGKEDILLTIYIN